MTCDRAEERFSEYYDRALPPAEHAEMESHLRTCERCMGEYKQYKACLEQLRSTSMLETSQIFAAGVVASVREEAKAAPPAVAASPPIPIPSRSWFWLPAAAAVAVAFLAGLLVPRPVEERIVEKPVDRPGSERLIERRLTERDKEDILRSYGLVWDGDRWLPRPMKEDFERGLVCLHGEMMTADEAFARLSQGRVKPPDVTPKTDVDAEMARRGYQKVGKLWVPQEWLEKWTQGLVQKGADEWTSAEEFKAAFMKEHNLVEFPEKSGTIMSKEHRDELLAQRVIRRPDRATAENEITAALEGLEIGPPTAYKNLTLYPILDPKPGKEASFLTLHASFESGKIELTDPGTPFEITVTNRNDRPVLLVEGEVLMGGRYSRVVAADTLVPAKKTATVPVYCVEPSGLRKDEKFTTASGHYFAAYGLRRANLARTGQGGIWSQLARQIEIAGGKPKSQAEVYRELSTALFEYRTYFSDLPDRFPDAIGVVVCIGESVEAAEIFQNRSTFASYFERILAASALEAVLRARDKGLLPKPSRIPSSLGGVRQLLQLPFFSRETDGVLTRDGRAVGLAHVDGERLAHLLLFAEMPPGDPDWRAAYKPAPEKLKKVFDEIDRRMRDGDVPERAQAAYEMSLVNAKEATARLLGHLADAEPGVRRAVILCLGQRRDPAAVPALLDVLEKSKRESVTHRAAVASLARIGDERAVDAFLRQLEGDAESVRVLLSHFAELLLQVRNAELLEKSIVKLILLQEELEAIVQGVNPAARWKASDAAAIQTSARAAFEGVTGGNFESAAKAREWWNKRENREAFLKERTGK